VTTFHQVTIIKPHDVSSTAARCVTGINVVSSTLQLYYQTTAPCCYCF